MRARRTAYTFGTAMVFSAVTMVVGLIAVPLLLHWLGEERYGAYRATADWYGYLPLFELGLGGALLPLLARAAGRGDDTTLRATIASSVRAYLRVTLFMLAGGIVLLVVIGKLVPVQPALRVDLRTAALLGTAAVLFMPLQPFRHLAEARQRGYHVNLLLVLQSLTITAAALFLAWRGWGITGQMAALLVGTAVFFATLLWVHWRREPQLVRQALSAKRDDASWNELWTLNRPTVVRRVCGQVSVMSDRIIVAAFLGPAAVVPLYVTQRLTELAQAQVQNVGGASWAGLAELYAMGDHETFRRRLLELTTLVVGLSVAVLVPIVAYNGHFVTLWVGGDRYAGDMLTLVAGGNALMLGLFTLWDWAFGGTGLVARLVPISIISTLMNLGLSLALTPKLGIIGPLLGTLAASVITTAWYLPVLLRRTFQLPVRRLLGAVARPALIGVPFAVLLWWIAHREPAPGWLRLAIEMSAAALLYLAAFWRFALSPDDRQMHRERLIRLFGREP